MAPPRKSRLPAPRHGMSTRMSIYPNYEEFQQYASRYGVVPVCRPLLSDGLTPVAAFRAIDEGSTACLFESVIGGERVGRYSFLAAGPAASFAARGRCVSGSGRIGARPLQLDSAEVDNPLDLLRQIVHQVRAAPVPKMPPFTGGAVGYAGYDTVRYAERLPSPPTDDRQLPDLSMALYDRMLVFDHITKTLNVIALAWTDQGAEPRAAYEDALHRIDQLVERLRNSNASSHCQDLTLEHQRLPEYRSNFTQQQFEDAVRRCVAYIRAGDIFQVVLSQRLELELRADPFEVYRSLRVLNPSPFMFFLRTPEVVLVGSSPEILCRVVDGVVTVRPLAGTRPRGRDDDQDRRLEQELLADPKERAEHTMLVDLGRNDVGRVARWGSVELPELMVVERYSHVMHLSSEVRGQLRDDCDAFDALAASLPAGTVSGAPKVRAMEIIDEFEPVRRGPYAGAVGYFDYRGNMDTCIALRTIVIQGNRAYVQAGAGIVADSDPTSEYQETLNKARVMLQAIRMTHQRLVIR